MYLLLPDVIKIFKYFFLVFKYKASRSFGIYIEFEILGASICYNTGFRGLRETDGRTDERSSEMADFAVDVAVRPTVGILAVRIWTGHPSS